MDFPILLDKYKPLIDEQENRNKRLFIIYKISYMLSCLIIGSSLAILLLNIFSKSDFQMRLIVGITQSAFGFLLAVFLIYIIYYRNKKIIVVYNITAGMIGLVYDAFILFLIIQYSKNDQNYSQTSIELKDVISGFILTTIQTFSLFISIYLLIRMKKIHKLCKKFLQNDAIQVSLQEEQKISTPSKSPQAKQIQYIADKDINQVATNEQKNQIHFFENCSHYTDSVLSDIENSIPGKKKITLKSVDALQNTDSDVANQKSQATKSDKNYSQSNPNGNLKYLNFQKKNKIYENAEEYEDDQDNQVRKKRQTLGINNNQQIRDKSYSIPKDEKRKQKSTAVSKSYYNVNTDI